MLPLPVIKWIIAGVLSAIIAALLYAGYSHIKSIGYSEAEAVYKPVIEKYEKDVNAKIATIEANSTLLVANDAKNSAILINGIGGILKTIKGQPLTIIKNGECLPTQTFSDTFGAINKRTNEAVKGTQK